MKTAKVTWAMTPEGEDGLYVHCPYCGRSDHGGAYLAAQAVPINRSGATFTCPKESSSVGSPTRHVGCGRVSRIVHVPPAPKAKGLMR